MNRTGTIILFTVLRLAAFAVPLAILLLLQLDVWFSTLCAALIGLSVSILLLSPLRERFSATLHEARTSSAEVTDGAAKAGSDEAAEDID